MRNKNSHDKPQEKLVNHVTKERNIFYRSNSKNSHDKNVNKSRDNRGKYFYRSLQKKDMQNKNSNEEQQESKKATSHTFS